VSTNSTKKGHLAPPPPSASLRASASSPVFARQSNSKAAAATTAAAPASEVLAGMSARERNRAKRKMRQGATDLKYLTIA
jgi:hypothetical protein